MTNRIYHVHASSDGYYWYTLCGWKIRQLSEWYRKGHRLGCRCPTSSTGCNSHSCLSLTTCERCLELLPLYEVQFLNKV